MKYLKLFEAFESSVLTNTIKFISKKVKADDVNIFKDQLKLLMKNLDIPISKINENDIEYLTTRRALKVENDGAVKNETGVYCIKYWFSLEKGYLGRTGVGNLRTEYIKYSSDSNGRNRKFDDRQLNKIKNELDIKTGLLIPVTNYEDLSTGQDIIGIFDNDDNDTYHLSLGEIYREDNRIFALNNTSEGSAPDDSDDWYERGFEFAWSLGSTYSPGNDHRKLHLWINDDKPLRYKDDEDVDVVDEEKNKLYGFNLPLEISNHKCVLKEWDRYNHSVIKFIEDSNFAIIVYLDRILSEEKVSAKRVKRIESRKSATALMNNEEIKRENINRYINKLITKYGITAEKQDFSKISKMVNTLMCDKFILIRIYHDSSSTSVLRSLSASLYNIIDSPVSDKIHYFDRLVSFYKDKKRQSQNNIERYTNQLNIINDSGEEQVIKIINKLLEIGQKMNNYITDTNIENIEDLLGIAYKLKSVADVINDDRFMLTNRDYRDIIYSLDGGNTSRYVNDCSTLDDEEFNKNFDKLLKIEKFIDSVLK